jgi:hypothetical protein
MKPVCGAAAPGGDHGDDRLKKADEKDGPTRNEIMAALKEKGIAFSANMKKDDLAELLKNGAAAPGGDQE